MSEENLWRKDDKLNVALSHHQTGYAPFPPLPHLSDPFPLLPLDHTLKITVMDWDRISADDLIGETSIDIENRFLSQHRATCVLPESFSK